MCERFNTLCLQESLFILSLSFLPLIWQFPTKANNFAQGWEMTAGEKIDSAASSTVSYFYLMSKCGKRGSWSNFARSSKNEIMPGRKISSRVLERHRVAAFIPPHVFLHWFIVSRLWSFLFPLFSWKEAVFKPKYLRRSSKWLCSLCMNNRLLASIPFL